MSALRTVWHKEMKENTRDRRTLLSALIFGPLFGPALFALMMTFMVNRMVTQADEATPVAVSGQERAANLIAFLKQQGVSIEAAELDAEGARAAIRADKHPVVLLIPETFPDRFRGGEPAPVQVFADGSDQQDGKHAARVRSLLQAYSEQLGSLRLYARGVHPGVIKPIVIDDIDVSTPAARSTMVLGMMTYFILFSMLIGGMYLTIDATAGERERGSLEVLFTAPAPRTALIYGKILAACSYMLISLAITLTAFAFTLPSVPLASLGMAPNLAPSMFLKLFVVAAPFALLGAGLMTVVASFTRTYKEAQTYVSFILLIPTLPILFASMLSLKTSDALMLVPSLSQHLLMTAVIRDEAVPLQHMLTATAVTLAAGLLFAWIAGRLYRREAVLG